MPAKLQVKTLSAMVRVTRTDGNGDPIWQQIGLDADGKPKVAQATKLVIVSRGEELPANLADGEQERLAGLNAIGTPEEVAAVGTRTLESDVIAAEQAAAAAEPKTGRVSSADEIPDLAALTDPELAAWIENSQPTVKALVEKVGGDAALAQRVIDAENTATGGDPRKSLVEDLERVAGGGGE